MISRRNGRRTFKERKTRTESVKNSKLRSAVSFGLIILLHEPKTRYGKPNPQKREQTSGVGKNSVRENKHGRNKRPIFTPPFIPERTESVKKRSDGKFMPAGSSVVPYTTDDRRSGEKFHDPVSRARDRLPCQKTVAYFNGLKCVARSNRPE